HTRFSRDWSSDVCSSDLVELLTSSPARRLLSEDGRVCGAVVVQDGREVSIRARAVVLAAGGFPNDPVRRKAMFPRDETGHDNLRSEERRVGKEVRRRWIS